jgi:regulatory protein
MTNVTATDIRRAAMDLLARREHSFQELSTKLSRRFRDRDLISDLIDDQIRLLAAENLQSDQRYVASFIRSRVAKRQGPLRISMDLSQKGISKTLVSQVFEEEAFDWCSMIKSLSESKYGNTQPQDEKEKAKRIRFFQYRGFNFDQINQVLLDQ